MEDMKADLMPNFKRETELAAERLAKAPEGQPSIKIEGADNKVLVKAGTTLAKEKIDKNMLLFPYTSPDGKDYFVCIDEERK